MRISGILMHISSLPGPYGIGTLGKEARAFVDLLRECGQSFWQILPLCPTGYGDSPYQSFCTFAGNPYFIDPGLLAEAGLLTAEELAGAIWSGGEDRTDYGRLYETRGPLLRRAFGRFTPTEAFDQFLADNRDWLEDYALFMALKDRFGGRDWLSWPEEYVMRSGEALEKARKELAEEISYHQFLQFQFFSQWEALRAYAGSRGVGIIGDVPIYVPLDSVDVWANHELFQLDGARRPIEVAGCPPDSFAAEGQLWGNPLYHWERLRERGYDWWLRRLRAAGRLYDVIRVDHFRGLESYWAVPAGEISAVNGRWVTGPGFPFIQAVREAMPQAKFIAEDLGYQTQALKDLLLASGWPGMKVMEFAFDSREEGDYLPHLYPVNSVCYSGTHDNLTLKQWFEDALPQDVREAKAYLGLNEEEGLVWGMIRGCMASASRLAVIQMQDYLELGGEARMNTPGTLSGQNWTWRARAEALSDPALREKIRAVTTRYGRLGEQ